MNTEPKMISLCNAVREYGIPKTTFEIVTRSNELPVYRLYGRARYFKRSELEAWIKSKREDYANVKCAMRILAELNQRNKKPRHVKS